MIYTCETEPAPSVAAFVRCYVYREFDTEGQDLIKPWHASNEISMPFFLNTVPVKLENPQTGQFIKGRSYGDVVGLGSQYNGKMTFNGSYAFFEIIFRPVGFSRIFHLSSSDFTNHIFDALQVMGKSAEWFFEKLCDAQDVNEMATLADLFILNYLHRHSVHKHNEAIASASCCIQKGESISSLSQLAATANMSVRSFERQFREQVGMSPKAYSCVCRFNRALNLKLQNPLLEWAQVSADCDFFDQMHLVKAFKKYAGESPSIFLKQTPLVQEVYSNRVKF